MDEDDRHPEDEPEDGGTADLEQRNTRKSCRTLLKEVGLDKTASPDHIIVQKFRSSVLEKCGDEKVAKMYIDRVSRVIGFVQKMYPEEGHWENLVNVEAFKEALSKLSEGKAATATTLTYIKEMLKCTKFASERWILLPDFPEDPKYSRLLQHALLFWKDKQTE